MSYLVGTPNKPSFGLGILIQQPPQKLINTNVRELSRNTFIQYLDKNYAIYVYMSQVPSLGSSSITG